MRSTSALRIALKRHTESAERQTIYAQRIAEELRRALTGTEIEGEPPTCLLVLCNGYFTTTAGEGCLFRNFCQWKKLSKYTGHNVRPRHPEKDVDYEQSRLRIVPFNHAFNHCITDVHQRE